MSRELSPFGDIWVWGSSFQAAGTAGAQALRSEFAGALKDQQEPECPREQVKQPMRSEGQPGQSTESLWVRRGEDFGFYSKV